MLSDTRKLDRLIRRIDSGAKKTSQVLAEDVVKAITWGKSGAPNVDTGNLRDSMKAEDGKAYTEVDYAPHLEYGTIYMPAKPFLRPAYDRVKRKAVSLYAKLLKD